jgi:hypothetical protein
MRVLVLAVLVCCIVALFLVAGCTFNLKNADGSLNTSFSTNPRGGTGNPTGTTSVTGTVTRSATSTGESTDPGTDSDVGGSDSSGGTSRNSGSSTGSSRNPDAGSMKAHFSVDCTRTLVDDQPDHTDTWTAKLNGNAPLMVSRNWNVEPAISSPQFYWTSFTEGGAKPTLHAEWIRICKSPPCTPCHFVYDGPAEIGASIRHDPKNAPVQWTALLTGIGSPTHEAVSDGKMDQYTTNAESSCTITDNHFMTVSLYLQSDNCFDTQYAPVTGYEKSFTFSDSSMITYTSTDPKASLDSTAVFHFGG